MTGIYRAATRFRSAPAALLALEDGMHMWGQATGSLGETFGEFVFNTGMTGYQEVLTDPSYYGQIVVMTYPEVGIYGVNPEDVESVRIQVSGFVVHHAITTPFNYRASLPFTDYLADAGIVAIEGVDTRALTRHLRTYGAMRGAISTVDLNPVHLVERIKEQPQMSGANLAEKVTPHEPVTGLGCANGSGHIVMVDSGVKGGIVRELAKRGLAVTLVPYDADADTVLRCKPDGVLISNGPGDPRVLYKTIDLVRTLLDKRIPMFGICLGHQLLGLALGGQCYKMCFGHRGVNHPVKDLASGQILITTHNHGFAVDPTSLGIPWEPIDKAFEAVQPDILPPRELTPTTTMAELLPQAPLIGDSPLGFGSIEISHLSLNDGTVEGLKLRDRPAASVQFHPEASPGPHDAVGFFDQFLKMMD